MGPSYEATESYLKLFTQSTIVTTIGQLLVLIGGSLAAILVAFAALNDAILLNVKIGDWNLLMVRWCSWRGLFRGKVTPAR